MPAEMSKRGLPGNAGVIEAFSGPVYLHYSYGTSVSYYNVPTGKPRELRIDGKPAQLYIWDAENRIYNHNPPTMKLIVPDVGDGGIKFEMYIAGYDLDLMRAIVDSVEIRSSTLPR